MKYIKYSKEEMLNIIEKEAFVFVETNLGDNYIIRKKDIADFIILEAERTGHVAEMNFYMPGIETPVLTTYGWFLNRVNQELRNEIIKRLVLLQTTNTRPENVKIFDTELFCKLNAQEMGIENNEVKNFDKFYKKYM